MREDTLSSKSVHLKLQSGTVDSESSVSASPDTTRWSLSMERSEIDNNDWQLETNCFADTLSLTITRQID